MFIYSIICVNLDSWLLILFFGLEFITIIIYIFAQIVPALTIVSFHVNSHAPLTFPHIFSLSFKHLPMFKYHKMLQVLFVFFPAPAVESTTSSRSPILKACFYLWNYHNLMPLKKHVFLSIVTYLELDHFIFCIEKMLDLLYSYSKLMDC